ncbi:unnamed protein product [Closterium sp. Yama58-4]|nr:unnamed protein product [Closterium sp. Yama58-4]
MSRGQHKYKPADPTPELRGESSQGAVEALQAAADRIRTNSNKRLRTDRVAECSRRAENADAAEMNEDQTGYHFYPGGDASLVDVDSRVYRFVRITTGGSGLSRVDIKELISILIKVLSNPGRLRITSLAAFDSYEKLQLADADLHPFEQVNLAKEGDLQPVIVWRRSVLSCVRSLYENVAKAADFVVKPPKDIPNAARIYKFPEMGSWWREVLKELPQGASVAAVIIYSDETTLTINGGLKGWHVYISLANIAAGNRWRTHGHRLVALLPEEDDSFFSKADQPRRRLEVFQEALNLIMEELKVGQHNMFLTDPYGIRRKVYPMTYSYVGDYPEQCKVVGTKSGIKTKYPCPRCLVPKEDLNNMDYPLVFRNKERQKELVGEMERAHTKDARDDIERDHSTHCIHSALWGQRFADKDFANPYRQITSDFMHMSLLGVYKHTLEGLKSKLSTEALHKLDASLRTITQYSRQSFFRLPAHTDGYFSGHASFKAFYHQASMQVLPVLLLMANVDAKTIRAVELFCHGTPRLVLMLMSEFKGDQKSKFNVPKIHRMLHVTDDIKRRGILIHYCTDVYEHVHVAVMKRPYRASNKRNAEASITRCCLNSELVEKMTTSAEEESDSQA